VAPSGWFGDAAAPRSVTKPPRRPSQRGRAVYSRQALSALGERGVTPLAPSGTAANVKALSGRPARRGQRRQKGRARQDQVASKRHCLHKRRRGVCGGEGVGGSGRRSGAHRRGGPAQKHCYVTFPRVRQGRCSERLAHEHHRGLGPRLDSEIISTASPTPWNNPTSVRSCSTDRPVWASSRASGTGQVQETP